MRVAGRGLRPRVADADDRPAVELVVRNPLVLHPGAVDERIAVVAAEPDGGAELAFLLAHLGSATRFESRGKALTRRASVRSSRSNRWTWAGSTPSAILSAGFTAGRPCVRRITCASPAWIRSSVSAPVGSTTMISAGTVVSPAGGKRQMFGPHAIGHGLAFGAYVAEERPAHAARDLDERAAITAPHRAVDDVHRRRADELRDEEIAGPVVELERRADLLDAAVVHHHDPVGHRHRLDLVVRHVDGRRLEPLVQRLDLGAHRDAELGVEIGQRLVEQEDLGIADDRPAHCDALPLSARELARKALQVWVEVQDLRRLGDALVDHRRLLLAKLQAERHVVMHCHVRIQRIALEHHRDVAILRFHLVDDLAVDRDRAAGDLLQPRQHSQQRRLAAAGRPDEHHEFAVVDVEADAVDDLGRAIGLLDVLECDGRHFVSSSSSPRPRSARRPCSA